MHLHQQIIQSKVDQISQLLKLNEDQAFLRLTHSIITGESLFSFDEADIIDGASDKGIDSIAIMENEEEATVVILQSKNTDSFSSNSIVKLRNGLKWIFKKNKSQVDSITNNRLKDKIAEYRSVQNKLGTSNITITVAIATNGLKKKLRKRDEFFQELNTLEEEYDNDTFAKFNLLIYGATELVDLINREDRQKQKIDKDVKIIYDANKPSYIKYYASGLKGVVCSVPGTEIANIIQRDPSGAIFDSNIRQFLGEKSAVNAEILKSCKEHSCAHEFWFLNNGLTVVCDKYDVVDDPDNAHVKIKNMQIVNGCQTATALALALDEAALSDNLQVLLRIYEAPNSDLVDKIVRTTNNQNRITSRNLCANHPIQKDMATGFRAYGYFYERKPKEFDKQEDIDPQKIAVNELVAQSFLSIVFNKPSDASRRKYKVWGEFYNQIFSGRIIEPYIISFEIHRHTSNWLRKSKYIISKDDIERKLANNAAFHVARITAELFLGKGWESKQKKMRNIIKEFQSGNSHINAHIEKSYRLLVKFIRMNKKFSSDLDVALKSSELERYIDDRLIKLSKKSSAMQP